jgi:hypothetical protein
MLMRRLSLALLLALGTPPVLAQQPKAAPAKGPQQPSAAQVRQFVANFEAGVNKGCMQNPSRYCACYARTLVTQYQPLELAAINNLAAANPQNASTIALMAAPFARACRAAITQTPAAPTAP